MDTVKITAPIYFEGLALDRIIKDETGLFRAIGKTTIRVRPNTTLDLLKAVTDNDVSLFFNNYPESKLFTGEQLKITRNDNTQWSKHHEVDIEGVVTLPPFYVEEMKKLQEKYTADQEKIAELKREIEAKAIECAEIKSKLLLYKEYRMNNL